MVGNQFKKCLEYNLSSKNNFKILAPCRKELNLEDHNEVTNWFKEINPP